jgi:hypothetical protein
MVTDGIRHHSGIASEILMTADMLQRTRSSYAMYKKHLEEQKRAEEVKRQQTVMEAAKKKKLQEQTLQIEEMQKLKQIYKRQAGC